MDQILQVNKSSYTRLDLFKLWLRGSGKSTPNKSQDLEVALLGSFEEELFKRNRDRIQGNIRRFCSTLSQKWQESNRIKTRFLSKNKAWLEGDVTLYDDELSQEKDIAQPSKSSTPSTSSVGRPSVSFEESSERTKRRKTKEIREKSTLVQLVQATKVDLRSKGEQDASKLLIEAVDTTPTRATKIRKAWATKNMPIKYTAEEALSLIIDADLTKAQYIKIRLQAKERNADIYSSYQKVRAAKEKCYPSADAITVSNLVATIELQALLDHTVSRILLSQDEVFRSICLEDIVGNVTLLSKWGCDGSTGHSEYKQRLPEGCTDTDIFLTSMVPLQLFYKKTDESKVILWQNPRPSSVRYCRPINFHLKKETTELTQENIKKVGEQINSLKSFQTKIGDKNLCIKYHMILTMIDGKICSVATSTTSTQTCYICKATPTEMNQLERVTEKEVNPDSFKFGLSTLHAWIRFFECIIHISYRLEFKKWQARGDNARLLKNRKTQIQAKFREQLGLLIDKVKPGGSGTSNDGNTARRFFKHPEVSAQITGVDVNLIKRFGTILQAMSSGYEINTQKFDQFAKDTAKLFVEGYPWFHMPVSVHKILVHGATIINAAVLPIGQLSEEAQECRNKDLKMYRRRHTRKISRDTTNDDLLRCLLVSSDPYITGLRVLSRKRSGPLTQEVSDLLSPPEIDVEPADDFPSSMRTSTSASEETDTDEDTDDEW